MHQPDPNPLVDGTDVARLKTVAVSMAVAAVVVSTIAALMFYSFGPEHGVGASIGVGVMAGFWSAPLFGGTAGNGLHEWRLEQAEKEAHQQAE